ncbi:MAG: hypothetical protein HC803_05015, partial [Saprospiraceae bacterium]|nr:hypothetical protein [Saprospiraceae bacterium]
IGNNKRRIDTKNENNSIKNRNPSELQKWRWIAGIAASIALILAVYIVMPKTETAEIAKKRN